MGDIDKFLRCKWLPISMSCSLSRNNDDPRNLVDKSFQALSLEEKRKIQNDISDGEEPIEESTEFVNDKLEELQRELNNLTVGFKKAYAEALNQENEQAAASAEKIRSTDKETIKDKDDKHDKDYEQSKDDTNNENESKAIFQPYVSSRKFLLMFLRSERFNARLSARRLAQYFKEKLLLFGKEKLTRRIMQSDLDAKDLSALRSGRCVIPGITDESGRLIVFSCRYNRGDDSESCINIKRALFYLFQCWLEDNEEAQKNGVVFIVWNISPSGTWKSTSHVQLRSETPIVTMFQRAIPVHIAAFHLCYDDLAEHMVINFILLLLPTHLRRRHICHFSPTDVCMLNMIPYGIDFGALSLAENGSFKDEDIIRYIDKLHEKEVNKN